MLWREARCRDSLETRLRHGVWTPSLYSHLDCLQSAPSLMIPLIRHYTKNLFSPIRSPRHLTTPRGRRRPCWSPNAMVPLTFVVYQLSKLPLQASIDLRAASFCPCRLFVSCDTTSRHCRDSSGRYRITC